MFALSPKEKPSESKEVTKADEVASALGKFTKSCLVFPLEESVIV